MGKKFLAMVMGLSFLAPGLAAAAPFAASPAGQQIIKDYGKDRYGQGLYNDAAYARQYVH